MAHSRLLRLLLFACLLGLGMFLLASSSGDQGITSLLEGQEKKTDDGDSSKSDAPPVSTEVPPSFASPSATLASFLGAMEKEPIDYVEAMRALQLTSADASDTLDQMRADRLEQVLTYLNYEPDTNQGIPTTVKTGTNEFSLLPPPETVTSGVFEAGRIFLEKAPEAKITLVRSATTNGAWLFSKETLSNENIGLLGSTLIALSQDDPEMRARIASKSIEGWLLMNMPASLQGQFLFVRYWQWLGLGVIIFAGLFIDLIFRLFFRSFLRRRIHKFLKNVAPEESQKVLRKAVRATGVLVATIIWRVGIVFLFLPINVFEILLVATNIMVVLAAVIAAFKITDLIGAIFEYRATLTNNKLDDLIVPLIRKTVKILIVIIGFIYFAQAIDYQITPLLAGLGIGGIGFAFAAQNSIENFFGSVTVLLDRPFQVGDWVVIDDVEGTVTTVGMRSTRVRTFYDSLVTVPNSILVNTKVNNYGMRAYRRWTTKVGLLYETRPEQVEAFCEGVRELVREQPYMRKDYYQVFLNEFGASAIEILVYVFWSAPDWQTELRERHRFMLDMMRVAEEVGVSFAYPTQTIYLARSPGVPPVPEDLSPTQDKALNEQRGREATRRVVKDAPWQESKPPPYQFRSAAETLAIDQGEDPSIHQNVHSEDGDTETRGSAGE